MKKIRTTLDRAIPSPSKEGDACERTDRLGYSYKTLYAGDKALRGGSARRAGSIKPHSNIGRQCLR